MAYKTKWKMLVSSCAIAFCPTDPQASLSPCALGLGKTALPPGLRVSPGGPAPWQPRPRAHHLCSGCARRKCSLNFLEPLGFGSCGEDCGEDFSGWEEGFQARGAEVARAPVLCFHTELGSHPSSEQ